MPYAVGRFPVSGSYRSNFLNDKPFNLPGALIEFQRDRTANISQLFMEKAVRR